MRFVLASNNLAKTEEITILANEMGHTVVNYRDQLGQKLTFPSESRNSQAHNALRKAEYIHQYCPNDYVLADDTGLYLAAFPERFGVVTAREFKANGILGTQAEQEYILSLYNQGQDRSAYLLAVMAVVTPNGQIYEAQGKGGVRIANEIRGGELLDGLDNILEAENGKTLSEMPIAEVVAYHDRSKALQGIVDFLKQD